MGLGSSVSTTCLFKRTYNWQKVQKIFNFHLGLFCTLFVTLEFLLKVYNYYEKVSHLAPMNKQDQAKKYLMYLDQNAIQHDFDGEAHIPVIEGMQWVYSVEHFNEISRKEDDRYFEVLERLGAQMMQIKLDAKYQITDEVTLYDYEPPKNLYNRYKETVSDFQYASGLFDPLQTFFFGNKDVLDPEDYAESFKKTIDNLLQDGLNGISESIDLSEMDAENTSITDSLSNTLKEAKEKMQPLKKLRKLITEVQFSGLNPEVGGIVDQIWSQISEKLHPVTKDQFFGKEKFPFNRKNDEDIKNPVFLAVIQCHTVLNYLGYWPDKGLPRMEKLHGINSDAAHIAYSFFCSGIVSADNRLCKKASAIYQYFRNPYKVYNLKLNQ